MSRRIAFLCIVVAGAVLDLVTKHAVFNSVGTEFTLIPGLLSVSHATNTGVVFGMFQGGASLFLIISALAVPVILVIFFRTKDPRWILAVGLSLILAGTIGNLVDRATLGYVRDFLKVTLREGRLFPWLFNVADSCICVGVTLLMIDALFGKKDHAQEAQGSPGSA